jgi:hypothetical protein
MANSAKARARTIDKVAKFVTRNINDRNVVVGPMLGRLSHDASRQIPYFTVATSGRKQHRDIRVDVEHDGDREQLIAALKAIKPPLIIHVMDDELAMFRLCEILWPHASA